jgi:LysR family transcriptional regulator, hydrogen peroxide-inducible genes activator
MTLNELRYIVAVADQRHFGRAAGACCVSQPTLSTQIKKLEEQLGVTLFERTNRSVRPTPIGEKVVRKGRKILEEVEDIRMMCRGLMRPLCGARTLGVIPTLAPYLLPRLLPPMRDGYPELELIVVEDLTERLIGRLMEHSLDVAAVALPAGGDDLIEIPVFDEPFLVACPAGHQLALADAIGLDDLQGEPILYLADGHCLREQALAICGGGGQCARPARGLSRDQPRDPAPAGRRRPGLHPASGPCRPRARRRAGGHCRADVRRHGQPPHRLGLPPYLSPRRGARAARRGDRRSSARDGVSHREGGNPIASRYRRDCYNQFSK